MSDFSYFFDDPCEIEVRVYGLDGVTELGKYHCRGYIWGANYFSHICSLLAREMSYSNRHGDYTKVSNFKLYIDTVITFFQADVRSGKVDNIQKALLLYINELKKYTFSGQRIFPYLDASKAKGPDHKEFEITIDRIFKRFLKMRHHRIIFYERVLKEYIAQKDLYNRSLNDYLKNPNKIDNKVSVENSVGSILSEIENEFDNYFKEPIPERHFEVFYDVRYLRDLLKLQNPEIERHTKDIPCYRFGHLNVDPEGIRTFFELFLAFREEMSMILPNTTEKTFFERVLMVLKRDFLTESESDLEGAIGHYIDELEKYEFLSLSKEKFFDRLFKMIYSLRTRRIAYYEAVLADYLSNKEKYDSKVF